MNSMDAKYKDLVAEIRKEAQSKKITFVFGNFNVLHPGHLRLLNFAKECGEYLVVGISPNQEVDVFVDEKLRIEAIESIRFVNKVFILRSTAQKFIQELKPDFVVKGKEHELTSSSEQEVVSAYGGHVLFGSGEIRFSSFDLLKRDVFEINFSSIKKSPNFEAKYQISKKILGRLVDQFKTLKVLVIGDLIVDEYITCDTLGVSKEDPTLVVAPIRSDKFIGGAAIVAAHAAGLGASVQFCSVIGDDELGLFAKELLEKYEVETILEMDSTRPTTLKQRFRSDGKTLLRVSHLRQHEISREIGQLLLDRISQKIIDQNLLVFSDFNYGVLPQWLVEEILELCFKHNVRVVADSQSSSQIGDISRFKEMLLITPTEHEVRLAVRDRVSGLAVIAQELAKKSKAENIFITLGAEGLFIQKKSTDSGLYHIDQLPALNVSPKDVSGAGDSLLICSALSLSLGASIWEAAYLGSLAAACQVGRVGNVPLSADELLEEIMV